MQLQAHRQRSLLRWDAQEPLNINCDFLKYGVTRQANPYVDEGRADEDGGMMARKPNYSFERNKRTKAKAAKREAKRQAKLAAKEEKANATSER